jgi:alpha-beta hydrolase superfamily lysophospholipase
MTMTTTGTLIEKNFHSFPIGYYELHPDVSINFQLNRFYNWVGDPTMLTEMREAAAGVQDYPTFTRIFLDLGEQTIASGQRLKGTAYLRMAEFFLSADDARKQPTRQRVLRLMREYHQVSADQHFRIPYESAWLSAYRFTPQQSKGTLVVFGGLDSSIEEWLSAAAVFYHTGYETVLFEGPGQGSTREDAGLPMTVEWQKPVGAVLDFFHLDDVTLMGFSLGGGLVIRAAAFESRVQRVIAYDICTSALECALKSFPAPVRAQMRGWLESDNADAINAFYKQATAQSLLLEWLLKEACHVSSSQTAFEMLKRYQQYETASISSKVTQDVLLLAGSEDHYVPVHQLYDQSASLTNVRSLTTRLFTPYEQAQNHVQVGNFGLAFRVIIEWMESLQARDTALATHNEGNDRKKDA